jgi:hypothetical protein
MSTASIRNRGDQGRHRIRNAPTQSAFTQLTPRNSREGVSGWAASRRLMNPSAAKVMLMVNTKLQ